MNFGHTYPRRRMAVLQVEHHLSVVYLKLRTASITLASKVDVLDVVGGVSDFPPVGMLPATCGGGGSDLPPAGMSPAKIEVDSTHMSASASANRFIDFSPLRLRKCRSFYIETNGTITQDFLQGWLARTNIRFAFAQLFRKSHISCGRPLRSWRPLTLMPTRKPNSDAALLWS